MFATPAELTKKDVEQRFAWARRQGNPLWLWPDTPPERWLAALIEIERVTRQMLSEGRATGLSRGIAEDIGIAAYTSGMGPLLGYWICEGLLDAPPAPAAVLRLHYHHNALRMGRLTQQTLAAVRGLGDCGVKVLLLKGIHTAFTCFPTPATRPVSDIDLLIAPKDKPRAEAVLCELGYRPEFESLHLPAERFWRHSSSRQTPRSLSLVHSDDPWGIDLHTSANRRFARGAPVIRFDDLWRLTAADPWTLQRDAGVLQPAAALLFLACHAGCGRESLRLLRLAELALFVRHTRTAGSLSWDDVIALGRRTETLGSAYTALRLTDALAPRTVPESVLFACERAAPPGVVRAAQGMSPATAQRVLSCPMGERFIWTTSLRGKIKQRFYELVPLGRLQGELAHFAVRSWRSVNRHLPVKSAHP